MGSVYTKTITLLVFNILLLLFTTPFATSAAAAIPETNEKTSVLSAQYRLFNQDLFVSVQPSLYAYYSNMTHVLKNDGDYAKLVTPQAVQPIADSIRKITRNMPSSDEQFANAVLSMVHQIPYNITGPKYPVETMITNRGDCTGLSLLAASIMKAGGLDVVLIHYTGIDPGHMNIGVYLPYTPVYQSILMSPTSFEFNKKTYWAAEATPQGDWKVGDQSYKMSYATPIIISLDAIEESSPGQVFANTAVAPLSSSITIDLSPQPSNDTQEQRALLISGSTQPANPGAMITVYLNRNGSYTDYYNTTTDSNGKYALTWNFTKDGTYYITSSWSGNSSYAGADSQTLTVFVGPESAVQFQSLAYNYIVSQIFNPVAIRPFLGVNDFLSVPVGTNVSLSYKFSVLQTGRVSSDIGIENITIPASEHTVRLRNRQTKLIQVPAQTMTVPTGIPLGYEPLRLPDDFNQSININFCFIVQNSTDRSYSFNVKGLNDYEVSNLKLNNQSSTAFLNATQGVEESTWYKVTTTITDNEITTYLQTEDGAFIESMSTPNSSRNSTQLVMLIANNQDNAVVLKDLKVEAVRDIFLPPETPTLGRTEMPFPYVSITFLLALTLIGALVYLKKKPKRKG